MTDRKELEALISKAISAGYSISVKSDREGRMEEIALNGEYLDTVSFAERMRAL